MNRTESIIGIGGMPRSGKDTLAELFIKSGYFGLSFGDVVRGFSRIRHKDKPDPISVANMTDTSNWLRTTYGPDVILKEALKQYKEALKQSDYKGLVLYSVRAPIEADWILNHEGQLIWVEADDQVRYKRAMDHLRQGEAHISLDEFKKQEALQWEPQVDIPVNVQMDLSYIRKHANRTLVNNSDSLDDFLHKAHELIESIHNP